MTAFALNNTHFQISHSITTLIETVGKAKPVKKLTATQIKQKKVDKAVELYTELNELLEKVNFDGMKPEQAAKELNVAKGFCQTLSALTTNLINDPREPLKYKEQLVPHLKVTLNHLEECVEALEILSDAKALAELDTILEKA